MMAIELTENQLENLLAQAAERGAARALGFFKMKGKQSEWISKEQAMEILGVSYHTLNRLVNQNHIRKNAIKGNSKKFYNRADIEAYMAGSPNNHKP